MSRWQVVADSIDLALTLLLGVLMIVAIVDKPGTYLVIRVEEK